MLKLSIITVCYNNLEGLKRTYDSIVCQTARKEFEWLIIDGNSNDGTKDFLEAHSAEIDLWVSEPDSGIYNAMNKGIRMASGEYLLFMNSGDILASKTIIDEVIPYLDGTGIIYGDQKIFNPNTGKPDMYCVPSKFTLVDFVTDTIPHQCAFIRSDIHKSNPYSEDYKIVSDKLFFAQQIVQNGVTQKKIPIYVSVFYFDGISRDWNFTHEEKLRAMKIAFTPDVIDTVLELVELRKLRRLPFLWVNRFIYNTVGRVYGIVKRAIMRNNSKNR